jgi:hypothetical protein
MNEIQTTSEPAPQKFAEQLVSMTRPPDDPAVREEIGQQVWSGLWLKFEARLSEQDLRLWRNPPERKHVKDSPEHLRLLHAFDDFLLCEFAEWGWRLLMSVGVLGRLSEWEKHSPALWVRFGKELELKSRVLRGEKQARLGEGIETFADGAIPELKLLLVRQKEEFGKRRRFDYNDIAKWMRQEISEHSKEFPNLAANLEQLVGFVANMPRWNKVMAQRFKQGEVRAQGFFYQWFAACSNRSPKDVKNQLSRLRTQR